MPDLSVPIVLRTAEDVRAVRRSRRLYAQHPIVFRLPDLGEPEAESLARRVDEYRSECGCSLGAKWMTAALLPAGAWLAFGSSGTTALPLRVAAALLFVLAAAGTGKTLGIVLAHRRLRRLFDQLLLAASHRYSVGG